jgi:hypothetical protein
MNIKIESEHIICTIKEMVKDINTGFHCNETRVIGEDDGIQIQIIVTKDEDDFIESGHGHKVATYSLIDSE